MKQIYPILGNRMFLIILLIINTVGTVYGYYWYKWQLVETPPIFLPFVPDSPTASLFFVFVLIAFLLGKSWPLLEVLAIVTLVKYGIWAVVMNLLVFQVTGVVDPAALMLIFSHGAMAIQGILYAPFYRIKLWHLVIAAIWTLHNDVIDYVFFMLPRYSVLNDYIPQIGYFTFWLSIFSIGITYYLTIRKNRFSLELPTK
ncbi:putative membrane protein YpjA [Cytobacillus horneckiae]|uniref:DUF1405 domain-containing protein n=1 Tax=Cytobacillus horneckiae TaxID=549687 RepID=A0A2N0ZCT2_9BACI|nr:DUF1405 domain-containing protein [Cytobacillus horneckiae]MBN6888436.1 DUF1405 domain-containing protein [Cytobacillus horneckiae]MCM3180164.1 DUF1405 domain-containing protein [Cytobacillus horneckiae]MEC1156523.1 DUF1405 domain-containing protein [Cytobacillus horneckiae]MED2938952.1 DUF1405 domain-containing protein [Cytobacillus horneckiae]PKG27304.1 DUF1405 domain-containing protein [Cytobacillus horneckiae]